MDQISLNCETNFGGPELSMLSEVNKGYTDGSLNAVKSTLAALP